MNSKVYKTCAVPLCNNTSIKTPNKLFVYVPKNKTTRVEWFNLARRDPSTTNVTSPIYFCEDHFDLPNDMVNYMEYHVMGIVAQVRMKPGCVPSKFDCQPDRKRPTCDAVELPNIPEKRKNRIKECEKDLKEKSAITKHLKFGGTSPGSSDVIADHSKEDIFECVVIKNEITIEEGQDLKDVIKQEFHEDDDKPYKCDSSQHEVQVHGEESKNAGEMCDKILTAPHLLEPYLAKETDEMNFKCNQCDKVYRAKYYLLRHIQYMHATEKPFKCKDCPMRFALEHYLRNHSIKHSKEKLFKCDFCPKVSKHKYSMKRHLKEMHKQEQVATFGNAIERPFKCKDCPMSFGDAAFLRRHAIIHSEKSPSKRSLKCDQCDKVFKTKRYLLNHKKFLHATEKPFQCEECPMSFSLAAFLKKHSIKHYKGTPFKCVLCPKTFKLKDSVDRHLKNAHKAEEIKMFDDVKVEPVMIYDSEVKREVSDIIENRIEVGMDIDVKQEPEEFQIQDQL